MPLAVDPKNGEHVPRMVRRLRKRKFLPASLFKLPVMADPEGVRKKRSLLTEPLAIPTVLLEMPTDTHDQERTLRHGTEYSVDEPLGVLSAEDAQTVSVKSSASLFRILSNAR